MDERGGGAILLSSSWHSQGKLLRWDANGVWSVAVAAEMAGRAPFIGPTIAHFILGGETVGGSTLTRFYAIHVFILPGVIMSGVALHLFLVLRHGISEMPKASEPVEPETYREDYEKRLKKTGVPFWPDAAWRDMVFSAILVTVMLGCAIIIGPPALTTAPNPSNIEANPMPDWYFWWYFAVLSMLPPELETWIILGLPVLGFILMVGVPLVSNRGQRVPSKRPWAVGIVIFGATALVVLTIYGYRKPWSPDFGRKAAASGHRGLDRSENRTGRPTGLQEGLSLLPRHWRTRRPPRSGIDLHWRSFIAS